MRCEVFYRETTDEYRVVNSGFSILAFLFGWLWFFIKGKIKAAISYLILYVISATPIYWVPWLIEGQIGQKTEIALNLYSLWAMLLLAIFYGFNGRIIVNSTLEDYGFRLLGVQFGIDEKDCLKLVKIGMEDFQKPRTAARTTLKHQKGSLNIVENYFWSLVVGISLISGFVFMV